MGQTQTRCLLAPLPTSCSIWGTPGRTRRTVVSSNCMAWPFKRCAASASQQQHQGKACMEDSRRVHSCFCYAPPNVLLRSACQTSDACG
jgi:hypothetical protein